MLGTDLPTDNVLVKPIFMVPNTGMGAGEGGFAPFAARLLEQGLTTVLRAWGTIGVGPNLEVVRDGPLATSFAEAAHREGVAWPGWRSQGPVCALLESASILVDCNETFGRVVADPRREWMYWVPWIASVLTSFTRQAAIHTPAGTFPLLLWRPMAHWGKYFLFMVVLLAGVFMASSIRTNLVGQWTVSPQDLLPTERSIFGDTGMNAYDGSRESGLVWWTDIADYAVFGRHFLTGRGFGPSLADADGSQVAGDHSLRALHSNNRDILSWGGVPMAVSWLVLQLTFAWSLLHTCSGARRRVTIFKQTSTCGWRPTGPRSR